MKFVVAFFIPVLAIVVVVVVVVVGLLEILNQEFYNYLHFHLIEEILETIGN